MTVYIGIDWSEQKHDVSMMNEIGEVQCVMEIEHRAEGFQRLDEARKRLGVKEEECVVGIETHHTMLVDYLQERGYRLYGLPPNAVKSAQGRYRQSGAKSDASDARLIADMLRTDRERYHEWVADSRLTREIRAQVNQIDYLTKEIWQLGNRLRAALIRYYPAALEIFSALDSPISLAWIQAYPTPAAAQAVSLADFREFARQHHHSQPKKWAACYARLQKHQAQASEEVVAIYAEQAKLWAHLMGEMVEAKTRQLADLQHKYLQHPDYVIYHSLPAAGNYLEPALLAKFGDNRQRFPTPAVVQALAGTCPVTKQSGKSRIISFRHACDHEFRQIVQQWAKLSIQASPWAEAYYQTVRPHCSSENEAYRKLANRWLEVLWRLWHDGVPYDEQKHLSANARRTQPRS